MLSLARIWRTKEVRRSILYVAVVLVLFRVTAHIPIPGANAEALAAFFGSNQFFGLLNIFSGGTLENFSIVALGVAPYITASIIFQLLGMILPQVEEMQKEEQGRQRINQWTRLLTVPLAALQAYGLVVLLKQQAPAVLAEAGGSHLLLTILSLTAGTVFVTWLGELISEKRVGNGISIMIFAGIIAGLPSFFQRTLSVYDRSQLVTLILFLATMVLTIVGVVVMHEAQRNVPVQYARQVRGSRLSGGVSTHLPLRVNMAGVIPIIFAISIILFPTTLAQFFLDARTPWLREAAAFTLSFLGNQLVYGVLYFVLVFAFTYFYTNVVFHPDRVAENLQLQGGFIPGIRPGSATAAYLAYVANRILLVGAGFLSLIAILPLAAQQLTGNPNLVIGGTSILIVVNVVIESVKQIEAQVTMREYEA
ncbi:preprotein translocase subunit SecY [Candidatus Uhrbacteria bacterium]|nr:preprotein translocase subunit SecY [Candidatus Uhrbacteria bacterium]